MIMPKKVITHKNKWIRVVLSIILVLVLIFGFFFVLLQTSPKIGAYGADFLRKIIGNQAVATMETITFKAKDLINNIEYQIGIKKPSSPWISNQSTNSLTSGTTAGSSANAPIPDQWNLPTIPGAGSSQDAGVWLPYLQDQTGRVVAYRTFVQPDSKRPYSITAIVAFDLTHTRLNFVLGTYEPYAANVLTRATGVIPSNDRVPGTLLAAFNGGFKYEHGQFGAYAGGLTSAPPKPGLGTLAIYKDGKVKIGTWGTEISATNDVIAYRQNGPVLIDHGTISDKINDPTQWGETITGGVVTWRSGIALSKDNNTLYYVAGPSLTVGSLAQTMTLVQAESALQLDINNFWVNFEAMRVKNNTISSEPLFSKEMNSDATRFLGAYSRDYFYITAVK